VGRLGHRKVFRPVIVLRKEILKVVELTFENLVFSSERSIIKLELVILSARLIKFQGHHIQLSFLLLSRPDLGIFVPLLAHDFHIVSTTLL
jgi:hypothetical protein